MDLFEKGAAILFGLVAVLIFTVADYGTVRYRIPAEPNKLSQVGLSLTLIAGNLLVGWSAYALIDLTFFSDRSWRSPALLIVFDTGIVSILIGVFLWRLGSRRVDS